LFLEKEQCMNLRGIRGATTIEHDDPAEILAATRELLTAICEANAGLNPADLASAMFTLTPDLHAVHPARAARDLGWDQVPLMCAVEIAVPGSLPRCIRVLLHWNTELPQAAIHHIYLHAAVVLRPDLITTSVSNL
jgi:chorismate mutase